MFKKVKVSNIHSVKLTKRGDNLTGSMSRCRNYVPKHNGVMLDVVLPTGKVCTISFERPVNYLCDAWHVFPSKYEAWTHFNRP